MISWYQHAAKRPHRWRHENPRRYYDGNFSSLLEHAARGWFGSGPRWSRPRLYTRFVYQPLMATDAI